MILIFQPYVPQPTVFLFHTAAVSSCASKNLRHAERDGATFSWSFCLPLSLIGVKFNAA
jgi:hypothetical protein